MLAYMERKMLSKWSFSLQTLIISEVIVVNT